MCIHITNLTDPNIKTLTHGPQPPNLCEKANHVQKKMLYINLIIVSSTWSLVLFGPEVFGNPAIMTTQEPTAELTSGSCLAILFVDLGWTFINFCLINKCAKDFPVGIENASSTNRIIFSCLNAVCIYSYSVKHTFK